MVLYHVVSSYHLLSAMICSQLHEEKSVLLCSEWIVQKFPQIEELHHFFQKVICIDSNYRFFHSPDNNIAYFNNAVGDLKRFSKIYSWGSQFSFGFVLNDLKLPYIFCEEAAGLLSRPEILMNIEKKDSLKSKWWELCQEIGAYNGSSPYAIQKLCNVKAQADSFIPDKDIINFDVIAELKALSAETREKILSFFNPPRGISIPDKSTLLLTQHFSNLLVMSFEEQALLYQIVEDYFLACENLIIKPHPDDLMYYSQLFLKAQIIRERFPSEFLPFILNNQPYRVATVSSTAIYNLRGHYQEVFELDTRYESDFPMTHRYYAALKIAQRIGLDVVCLGANEVLACRLSETLGEDVPQITTEIPDSNSACVYLIDNVTASGESGRADVVNLLHSLQAGSCAVMVNSQDDYCWYNYEEKYLWNDIAPLVLKKTALKSQSEDFYASLEDETIYIYSKDKELLKMAKETAIKKELPHTGIMLENRPLDSRDEKIKMLEGILAATENRLLYYIEKEKQEK